MAKQKKKERGDVWWLAEGSKARSRQPSFAPPTARPVVSYSFYRLGWHRKKACFVTSASHGWPAPATVDEYPCDPAVAYGMLERCTDQEIQARFFGNSYASEDDAEVFEAGGCLFGLSLSGYRESRLIAQLAEANLHFYAPDWTLHAISLHSGMTESFRRVLSGVEPEEIQRQMQ